jgi:hypothetical protein
MELATSHFLFAANALGERHVWQTRYESQTPVEVLPRVVDLPEQPLVAGRDELGWEVGNEIETVLMSIVTAGAGKDASFELKTVV